MIEDVKTHPCSVCGREYMGEDPKLCGAECKQTEELYIGNLGRSFATPSGGDPRIFFYDASFGFLVDRWTVLLLQRMKCQDIEMQKEIDFHMHRIRRCLETKVATRQLSQIEREIITRVGRRILSMNSKAWHLRSLAKNSRLDAPTRAQMALEFIELMDKRALEIRQLDLLVTGRTHSWKYY
jgi:hypothetical protein